MNPFIIFLELVVCMGVAAGTGYGSGGAVSEATQECIGCHESVHPGITQDWRSSRHAAVSPRQAMDVSGTGLKVSSRSVPESLKDVVVGCAECHILGSSSHPDTFRHNGYDVHVVVSPDDCAICHSREREQFDRNIMAHARKNLAENPVYQQLQETIIGSLEYRDGKLAMSPSDPLTRAEACFYCHGTVLQVTGTQTRDTVLGEMQFPVIDGWPNQGVGRSNPDGSLGACSACHSRHRFSMAMARKPYTCKECHVGPDVPAFKVYMASKHGNIFSSMSGDWDFNPVPWTVGKDFSAPTCAVCHISLLVNADGEVVAERTHQMNPRLAWRIFGLIYAHPHPLSPDTSIIQNKDGLTLPTAFDGTFSTEYLIDESSRHQRNAAMKAVCTTCHDTGWVEAHWQRYEKTIQTTNTAVLTATSLMGAIWKQGTATGIPGNPFDEAIEKTWQDAWLFYANTIRFASAMGGGGDFGVFAEGRYPLTRCIRDLEQWCSSRHWSGSHPDQTPSSKTAP